MKLSELLSINQSITGQLSKIEVEVNAKIDELTGAVNTLTGQLADVPLTQEQMDSVTAVQAAVNALDALVPDPVVAEPVVAAPPVAAEV